MKKILVFGGTGAMGVYLVEILSKTGLYEIDVTSRSNRESTLPYLKYIKGNARDNDFMRSLLSEHYDVIIDFMNYNLDEFADRCNFLLSSCGQYVWFSSSRVYANSIIPITESSPRLLEVSQDKDFLATNRYALRKARQEDLITKSGFKNYTIIRPYITYSNERLQLGIYEKEQWLYRILKGRDLVINKNIIDKQTTLTYGYDVSLAISKLVYNQDAFGKVIQIASSENMTWREILKLYLDILKEKKNLTPRIYLSDHMQAIDELYEGGYNTIYDRVFNRHFDSSYLNKMANLGGGILQRNEERPN
ncbi:NAD-dependent epimerase/dehydratase family protein [uncultured Prevotella sp.]|uniref:NAD-dependent epimerase/dehydratase family protein n=1 Tax=uncultured Prevotella sp. TaxID=159272 RepID=UPI0025FAC84F|nr:NAD-dependent epimerase/dehydratase family protein [uncultured Prevotella sp.]